MESVKVSAKKLAMKIVAVPDKNPDHHLSGPVVNEFIQEARMKK